MSKSDFHRGLDEGSLRGVIRLLKQEVHKQFRDDSKDYQICIRNNYINIYANGCSLLKYAPNATKNNLMVHYKYLADFHGDQFSDKNPYVSLPTNKRININPEKVGDHTSEEKRQISDYLKASDNGNDFLLLDLEVAFTRTLDKEEMERRKTQRYLVADRIDMACLYPGNGMPILKLVEVKLTRDPRLKSDEKVNPDREPEIMAQMKHYKHFIDTEKNNIIESYQAVARNYVEFIMEGVLKTNYFSSIGISNPKKVLKAFVEKPLIDDDPHLLILGPDKLKKGKNDQDHWDRLKKLFSDKGYPQPVWPQEKLCN